MIRFLKQLFGGHSAPTAVKEEPAVEYDDFRISPCPRKVANGWSTEAVIRKTVDGEAKQHAFIRADVSTTKEAAVSLIINKTKTMIDQQGDKIFP